MSFSISSIKSKSEIEKALSLVARIFSTHTSISETNFRKNKKLEWSGFDFFKDDDIIVAKDSDIVIGVIRLVYRIVHIKGQPYKTAGFTDVCINKEYREKGISKKLMKYAINKANFNCDIGLLFARSMLIIITINLDFGGCLLIIKVLLEIHCTMTPLHPLRM